MMLGCSAAEVATCCQQHLLWCLTRTAVQPVTLACVQGGAGIVPAGAYVRIRIPDVPAYAAARVCGAVSAYLLGAAPPITAFVLHKHEGKLSVANMAVKKCSAYTAPVANKEQLRIVTGLRSFVARPILSGDDYNADKFKMERFMHEGRSYMLTAYAPISFPPLPVLAFKEVRALSRLLRHVHMILQLELVLDCVRRRCCSHCRGSCATE
jgi:40S ribosome biogenesis protein Tsr1 and BMS1 C-terminal